MKDLRILYTDTTGKRILKEYDLIYDFIDEFKAGNAPTGSKVFAELFENPLHHKECNTLEDLYTYCMYILS